MLTDTALRNFKPKSKTYKASDRDGMYVTVSPTGTVTPDLAAPQAGKVAPEVVALRAQPRPVTRLNRRTLATVARWAQLTGPFAEIRKPW